MSLVLCRSGGCETSLVLRRGGLILALAAAVAGGCAIDRIEWESSGFAVDAAAHVLREEHHVRRPVVECIKREVGGAVWECRARAAEARFSCEVHAGPHEKVHEVECEREDGEQSAPEE
jgi:hypothetical protein